MQYFLDISLIAVLLVTVLVYWHRGLIRSLMGAAKTVLAIVITYMFGETVSQWLHLSFVQPVVHDYVHTRLEEAIASGELSSGLAKLVNETPRWLQKLLELFHVDIEPLLQDMAEQKFEEIEALVLRIADPMTEFFSSVVGHAAVFLIASLLLSIVTFILGKVADIPVIRKCDRALGLILGLVCSLVYSSVYVLLIYVVLGWFEIRYSTVPFSAGFEASQLFRHAYEWNLFKLLFGF